MNIGLICHIASLDQIIQTEFSMCKTFESDSYTYGLEELADKNFKLHTFKSFAQTKFGLDDLIKTCNMAN